MPIAVSPGFAETERDRVVLLFWQAFAAKLGPVLGDRDRAIRALAPGLNPDFALAARDGDGRLLGLAGFKTADGAFSGGSFADLATVYGRLGALWRGLLLSLLERRLQPGVFQMDGIFVDAAARGLGAGTALLQALIAEARRRGMAEVQLDVIDTNPAARALCERVGFRAVSTDSTGPLRLLFGFSSATRMRLDLQA